MKKTYKIIAFVIIILLLTIGILNEMCFSAQTWIGNAVGLFVIFFPIEMLFFLLGHDKELSSWRRLLFKIIFWHIIICYILGGTITLFLK